eukprot:scpid13359/ scgid15069/ Putative ATP-dependent RNA helicase ucp12
MKKGKRPNAGGGRSSNHSASSGGGGGGGGAAASADSASAPQRPPEDSFPGCKLRESPNLKSWTGKSPLTQLHELCQRNAWLKPQFDVFKGRGGIDGWQCRITLSRREKKTSAIETVSFAPREGFRTLTDAKHFSSVFTLQAVNGHKPMQLVLPYGYRDYWIELDKERKAGKLDFLPVPGSDPFAKKPVEEEKAERRHETARKVPPFLSIVRMNEQARAMIVTMLSQYEASAAAASVASASSSSSSSGSHQASVDAICRLGFHPQHVREATENASDREGIIHWLSLHLPEADLPHNFQAASWGMSASHRDQAGLAREYQARRIAESLGFSVPRCLQAIDSCDGDALQARCSLLKCIVAGSDGWQPPVPKEFSSEELSTAIEQRLEETMVLQAILGDRYSSGGDDGRPATVQLELPPSSTPSFTTSSSAKSKYAAPRAEEREECVLEIYHTADSLYPYGTPSGLLVHNKTWPMYTRLHIVQAAGRYAEELAARSDGMVFISEVVTWLEEQIPVLSQVAPTLMSLSYLRTGNDVADASDQLPAFRSPSPEESDGDGGATASAAASASASSRGTSGKEFGSLAPFRKPPSSSEAAKLRRNLEEEYTRRQTQAAYKRMLPQRQRLPASKYEDEVVQVVEKSSVTIIQGETGCGKSTQVPQFVLDNAWKTGRGDSCFIVVTQPRRLAAMAVAERVASERGEKVGKYVGYSVRLESKCSSHTRLLFCTTGVLLRWCQEPGRLQAISHLIVDEVHERSNDMDTLLALIRIRMQHECSRMKVVLMSATLHTQQLSEFFLGCPQAHSTAQVVKIPGFTYPVDIFYWEDVKGYTRYVDDQEDGDRRKNYASSGGASKSASNTSSSNIPPLDLNAVVHCVSYLVEHEPPSVMLVFLPGLAEILKCISQVSSGGVAAQALALPLHSSLSPAEQHKIFEPVPRGKWKVVFTTNIAETSITVDGVTHVLDAGRVKQTSHDPSSGLQRLVEVWTSQSSCKQRTGRAGRTRAGICWRLFTQQQFAHLTQEDIPEIQRTSLEQLCLQTQSILHERDIECLKKMKMKSVKKPSHATAASSSEAAATADDSSSPLQKERVAAEKLLSSPGSLPTAKFLLRCMLSAPSPLAVAAAVTSLIRIEAVDAESGFMTNMGKYLCKIPADARIAKCLVLSAVLGCVSPILTIAACLTHRSPFLSPSQERDEAKAAHKRFLVGKSDLLAYAQAYNAWYSTKIRGLVSVRQFCSDNFLSHAAMESIHELRQQFLRSLRALGLCSTGDGDESKLDVNSDNARVVKACLCAGLYPNVAQIRRPEATYHQTEHGTVQKTPHAKELSFQLQDRLRAVLHPSSLLFDETVLEDPLVVFHEKVHTSRVFIRGVTTVAPYQLLLFCGHLQAIHQDNCIIVDNWLRFQAPGHVVSLLLQCRRVLDQELARKLRQQDYDIVSSPLMSAVVQLLSRDGV